MVVVGTRRLTAKGHDEEEEYHLSGTHCETLKT
jgi:hypothetical protein